MPSTHFPASRQHGAFPQKDLGKQTAPRVPTAPGQEECGERGRRASLPPNRWAGRIPPNTPARETRGTRTAPLGDGHQGGGQDTLVSGALLGASHPFSCESAGSHSDVKMSAKILPFIVHPKRLGNCWEVCGHSLGYFEQLRGDNHFWCSFP